MSEQLEYLINLVSLGFEYPDAEYKTFRHFDMDEQELQDLRNQYDNKD